jgi:hypothetical protein
VGDVLYRLFQLLSVIVQLNNSSNWVVGAVGWCWVSGAGRHCGWSGGGGATGGVEHFRHLAMVDAAGVVAEGCVGVLVLEGFGLVLVVSAALSTRRWESGGCGGVVVKVPGRRGKLVPGRQVVKQVGRAHPVGRSQVGSWSFLACSSPLFMLLRGWRL